MSAPNDPLEAQFGGARRVELSLDERRAKALLARRLLGVDVAEPVMVGRFELHERLGSGGLGVVYRAWDPLLKRDAAVKVLRADAEPDRPLSAGARAHLTESRHVARLAHPNIVEIFDSGVLHDGDVVYVVMEFLSGGTLEAWLGREERATTDILAVFDRAAAALEAAHAAGIVHRDFKPANVLFDADDGVRVVDFGTHGTVGTMPPEQERGEPADPRMDVYALCVSLRRALGARRISWRLDELLRWGCEPNARDRCPSVSRVREALAPRRPRFWLPFGASALALGTFAIVVTHDPPCAPPDLQRVDVPEGPSSERMDAFVEAWSDEAVAFCEATDVAIRTCLEGVQSHWNTVAAALESAPATSDVLLVLDGLPDPADCRTEPREPSHPTPLDASFETLRVEIRTSQFLGTWAERGDGLLGRLERTRMAAVASGNRRVEAGAALYLGLFEMRDGHVDEAERLYRESYLLATRAGDDALAFHAADRQVELVARLLGDMPEAQLWMLRARQAAARRIDPEARSELSMLEGRFAMIRGEHEAAVAAFDDAEGALADDASLETLEALYAGRAQAEHALGNLDAAARDYQRVLDELHELSRASLMFAYTLQGLGGVLLELGRLDEAEAVQRRLVRSISEQQPDSPDLAAARFNLSQVYSAKGDHAAALGELELVRERFEAYGGPEHPGATAARSAMAEQHEALGDMASARREAEAALRWGVPQQYAGGAQLVLARREIADGDEDAARERLTALAEHPETPQEARTAAAELLRTLRTRAPSPRRR